MTQKVYKQKYFSVTPKNSNWEILVTFKRSDDVKDEKLQYFGGSLKNPFVGGGGVQKTNIEGGLTLK